jgi:glycogen debranching enzyme
VLGLPHRAAQLRAQAEHLRDRFEQAFWSDELGMYALALDGRKRPCLVRTSNAGHALFCRIAGESRARRTTASLLGPAFFSDWGIRTVATTESRYNPMSYHNGSVWPHDNAIIAAGFAEYGMKDEAARILGGLFQTALYVQLFRMPELYCGFQRRPGEGPTLYPVACAPQAWAAGAVFMLLQACLGLRIRAAENEVRLAYSILPEFLSRLVIRGLRVGDAQLDLILDRHDNGVSINVARREGNVHIVALK